MLVNNATGVSGGLDLDDESDSCSHGTQHMINSFADSSADNCLEKAYWNYFQDGTLPAPETVCQPAQPNAFLFWAAEDTASIRKRQLMTAGSDNMRKM